ncbi:MAG TPA: hypothetical protein VGO78_10135, partial [Acidimicrobiales bacterium]|nr:hypothetical protein [Acidimicrobiales bacterium]
MAYSIGCCAGLVLALTAVLPACSSGDDASSGTDGADSAEADAGARGGAGAEHVQIVLHPTGSA